MSTDYGRLTAEDRREVQEASAHARDLTSQLRDEWFNGWFDWAWFMEPDDQWTNSSEEAADILESLLMTDRWFR